MGRWKRWWPLIAGRGSRVRHGEWGIDLLLRWLLLRRFLGRWCLGKARAGCGYLKRRGFRKVCLRLEGVLWLLVLRRWLLLRGWCQAERRLSRIRDLERAV